MCLSLCTVLMYGLLMVSVWVCQIPVTYAGGVTVMNDLERIKVAGDRRVDVTVGSALDIFGGNLPYKDVVSWHTQQETLMV